MVTGIRYFHSSVYLEKGRKTGSKALDPPPRELSKKQKKRKAEKRSLLVEKRDPAKEKLKERMIAKKANSSGVEEFAKQSEKRFSYATMLSYLNAESIFV